MEAVINAGFNDFYLQTVKCETGKRQDGWEQGKQAGSSGGKY